MDRLLKEIDTLKKEVAELKIQKKSIRNLDKDFQIKYIYNSNAIEGNTLTLHETKVVLEGITIGGKTLREHFEVINHAEAILYIEDMVKNKEELSEYGIKAIHNLILKNIDNENAGRYRKQNVIISGAEHIPPDFILIPEKMEEFINWYKTCNNMHPVLKAAKVHVDFVEIHPFIDGNGRVSRLIMNLELLKNGYQAINIRNDKKLEYYEALDTAHCHNDYSLFYKLIAEYELERLKEITALYNR